MASPLNTLQKSKAIIKRKSRKKIKNRRSKILDDDMQDINIIQTSGINTIPATMHGVFEIREASEVSQSSSEGPKLIIKKRYSWWRRFLNALKHRNWLILVSASEEITDLKYLVPISNLRHYLNENFLDFFKVLNGICWVSFSIIYYLISYWCIFITWRSFCVKEPLDSSLLNIYEELHIFF